MTANLRLIPVNLRSLSIRTCANPECSKNFKPKAHNQKYCTDECCRVVTNKRIMEKYYEEKAIREGKERMCDNGCGTVLTRYNLTSTCFPCDKRKQQRGRSLLERLEV